MGLFWDLIQQSQIGEQKGRTASLEQRVAWLERELQAMRSLVSAMLQRLEQRFGEDFNRDGRIG